MFYIFLFVVFVFAIIYVKGQESTKINLKKSYDEALKNDDKRQALESGRAYYSSLRKDGKLTIYDEQAISNDLNAMSSTIAIIERKAIAKTDVIKDVLTELKDKSPIKAQGLHLMINKRDTPNYSVNSHDIVSEMVTYAFIRKDGDYYHITQSGINKA